METVYLPKDSFWRIAQNTGDKRNPLNYYCAPNAATPNYVASYDIKDFIAFGFLICFSHHTPGVFPLWPWMPKDFVKSLREAFLNVLENTCESIWSGDVECGQRHFDWGIHSDSITIGEELPVGEVDESKECRITWALDMIEGNGSNDDPAVCLILSYAYDGPADDYSIWFKLSAIKNKRKTRSAINAARRLNRKADKCLQ